MLKHYLFVLMFLALTSYISLNIATTAKHTDSTAKSVESIVTKLKEN